MDFWELAVKRGDKVDVREQSGAPDGSLVIPAALVPNGPEDHIRVFARLHRRYELDDPALGGAVQVYVSPRLEWTVRLLPAQPPAAPPRP